jgi:hypothetical protein
MSVSRGGVARVVCAASGAASMASNGKIRKRMVSMRMMTQQAIARRLASPARGRHSRVMGHTVRLVALALLGAGSASAQSRTSAVVGIVRDSAGAPVSVVTITIERLQALTDSAGRFSIERLPASGRATLTARRLGFHPTDTAVVLVEGRRDSLVITLVALPIELPGVTTTADERLRRYLADYVRHREGGSGRYYDRAQMTAMRVSALTDVLRRVPGVRIVPDRNGRYVVRMGRQTRSCPPDIWIDNVRAHGMNADDIPLMDIEAIEVYAGPAGLPPEYINRFGNPSCGAIIIWTRMPG